MRPPAIVSALLYLQATSLVNQVMHRLRRLRQPKYLIGAVAGVAYLYAFVFRRVFHAGAGAHVRGVPVISPELLAQIGAVASVVLLVALASAWLFPGNRAALRFSEAEVAFLFPAPVSRAGLIHFSVLRAQLGILLSAVLMAVLSRRSGLIASNAWLYGAALWLMLATVKLHFIGASFVRERLVELGLRPVIRRALFGGIALLVIVGCWAWLRTHVAAPSRTDLADARSLAAYIASVLGQGPVAWVLAPFRALLAPMFAADANAFLRALPWALLLLTAHYAWVVRSQVAFEEASIDQARKRAVRVASMREGNLRLRPVRARARRAPFVLAAGGFAPVAFLWKGLIAAGPVWRFRTWLVACAIAVAGTRWLAADPSRAPALQIVAILAAMFSAWALIVGPMLVQRGLRETLDHLDILRATPLRGWQIALGQLATPVTVLAFAQWFLLLTAVLAFTPPDDVAWMSRANALVAAGGVAVFAPVLIALVLCVPFAGLLLFPAWSPATSGRGGGIEVMGQRLIFGAAYLLALACALLPATLAAGAALFVVRWLAGTPVALGVAALVVLGVLAAELAVVLRWLGGRIERFDVSTELR